MKALPTTKPLIECRRGLVASATKNELIPSTLSNMVEDSECSHA